MSKDAYYIKHDYTAAEDHEVRRLIRLGGLEAYGIFWRVVEMLYTEGGRIPFDADQIAFDLRSDPSKVKLVVTSKLFFKDVDNLASRTVDKRMAERNQIRELAHASAMRRWSERHPGAMRPHSERNATAMPPHSVGNARRKRGEEKERITKVPRTAFAAPTVTEVADYCHEDRKNGVSAIEFHNHYAAKGWMIGKSPMKDWKAAVRTWERDGRGPREEAAPAAQRCQNKDCGLDGNFVKGTARDGRTLLCKRCLEDEAIND
jgi:hypothetical protein